MFLFSFLSFCSVLLSYLGTFNNIGSLFVLYSEEVNLSFVLLRKLKFTFISNSPPKRPFQEKGEKEGKIQFFDRKSVGWGRSVVGGEERRRAGGAQTHRGW